MSSNKVSIDSYQVKLVILDLIESYHRPTKKLVRLIDSMSGFRLEFFVKDFMTLFCQFKSHTVQISYSSNVNRLG